MFLIFIIIFSIFFAYVVLIYYKISCIFKVYIDHQRKEQISEASNYFMFRRNDIHLWRRNIKKLEFLLSAIFLLPFRFILLFISAIFLIIWIKFLSYLKDYLFIRKIARLTIRIFSRIVLFLSGFYFIRTKFHKIKDFLPEYQSSSGQESFPIVICNHISWVDSFILSWKYSGSFLYKKEMSNFPIISQMGKFMDLLYFDRSKENERQLILQEIQKRISIYDKGLQEIPLIIFPEGTTSNGSALLTFKKGSFFCMAPIKIICLKYNRKSFNPLLDHVSGMGTNMILTFCQLYNDAEIFEFNVFEPDFLKDEWKNWEVYAEIVRNIMSKCLGVKRVEMGFRDSFKYNEIILKRRAIKKKKIRNVEKVLVKKKTIL